MFLAWQAHLQGRVVISMSDEQFDFAQELEQFLDFDTPKIGDLRKGVIISITPQVVIVAIDNLKRDGIVPYADLEKLDEQERNALAVNDEVTVKILKSNPDSLEVSIYQARIIEDWDRAEALKESGDSVDVEVIGYNKGGLIAPFGRLRGFIPLSQASGFSKNMQDRDRQRKLAKLRGEKIPVKVIEVDRERRRLVFSEREGQKEAETARKGEFFDSIKPGDILKGRIRSIRDFGAFVDLGDADGLIHVSELAWYRVDHPKEVVRVGDEVEVQVIKVDVEEQRVSLTRKPLLVNPWTVAHETYPEGALVEGLVVRTADYGSFVELEPGVEGLLHITQLSRSPVAKVEDVVKVGERHLLRVLSVDSERQRIRLSLKSVSAQEQIEWMTRQQADQSSEKPSPSRRQPAPAVVEQPVAEVVESEPVVQEDAPTVVTVDESVSSTVPVQPSSEEGVAQS